jgi:hypothetical protein
MTGSVGTDAGGFDGLIAPFWTDLTTDSSAEGAGIYYQLVESDDPRLHAFNKLIVEYQVPVWNGDGTLCHFEVILSGDGTVVLQYQDMPENSGSWNQESIGFEDQSGALGVQISYGMVPGPGTAYTIPPACHVTGGDGSGASCCTSQICQCEGEGPAGQCSVQTDYGFEWVDIIASGTGTRIGGTHHPWEQNDDDGWYHVNLPFDFNWFGSMESRVTIGTNGILTFGDAQLPYGDSEPVPCQWNGGGQGAGGNGCVQVGDAAVATGGHYGVEIDGIIAVFWCDLNPGDTSEADGSGVYFLIQREDTTQRFLYVWDQLIVEYQVPVFGGDGSLCHFESILRGDGTVILQYKDMPAVSGSWSHESIGFEDKTGTQGVQVLYGTVPAPGTAYEIPSSCHALTGENPGCCSSQMCPCEGSLDCTVITDFPYAWVDIIKNGAGTLIGTDANPWEGNNDDGWIHIDLPFDFNWYGQAETTLTIGTNPSSADDSGPQKLFLGARIILVCSIQNPYGIFSWDPV